MGRANPVPRPEAFRKPFGSYFPLSGRQVKRQQHERNEKAETENVEELGSMDPDYHFKPGGQASYNTSNLHTGISTSINSTSLQVRTGGESWSISLTTWGRGNTNVGETPFTPTYSLTHGRGRTGEGKYLPASTANRLEYRVPGLTAWYANGQGGGNQVADGLTGLGHPAGASQMWFGHQQGSSGGKSRPLKGGK